MSDRYIKGRKSKTARSKQQPAVFYSITNARLMRLSKWLKENCKSLDRIKTLAERWGTTHGMLRNYMYGANLLNSLVLFTIAQDTGISMEDLVRDFLTKKAIKEQHSG